MAIVFINHDNKKIKSNWAAVNADGDCGSRNCCRFCPNHLQTPKFDDDDKVVIWLGV